jgi:hypothetical protein
MKLIFFFSAYARPSEEFNGILNQLGRPYIKFFDTSNRWYMGDNWKAEIQNALDKYGAPELSIGYSMGGWGALYHQPQVQADKVVAFGPQGTTIAQEVRRIGGKYSEVWAKKLDSVNGCRLPPPSGKYTVYFGNHRDTKYGDSGHRRLINDAGYHTTTVYVPMRNDHDIVGQLYNQGKLVEILKSHIDNS